MPDVSRECRTRRASVFGTPELYPLRTIPAAGCPFHRLWATLALKNTAIYFTKRENHNGAKMRVSAVTDFFLTPSTLHGEIRWVSGLQLCQRAEKPINQNLTMSRSAPFSYLNCISSSCRFWAAEGNGRRQWRTCSRKRSKLTDLLRSEYAFASNSALPVELQQKWGKYRQYVPSVKDRPTRVFGRTQTPVPSLNPRAYSTSKQRRPY